jgi:predicted regulator of Ras-like GTPase activity (Roadblock/LC7/MglB family)
MEVQIKGIGMTDQLMSLLEFRVVLGALITTIDGLVVAHAGLSPEDADLIAASSSVQPDGEPYSSDTTRGGTVHVLRGHDIRLVILSERSTPRESLMPLMHDHLAELEASLLV